MYNFRTLKSHYSILIRYRLPDYTLQEYSSTIVLEAKQRQNNFLFTLHERLDVRLNNEVPRKTMDSLMMELGNSIYPMQLNVSSEGKILSVFNFDEIRERWYENSSELLEDNYTPEFRKYIEISRKNFSDEEKFREILFRDTFVQLFFQEYDTKILELTCENFPKQSKKTTFYAKKTSPDNYNYKLFPAFKENNVEDIGGDLICELMPTGEISKVEAFFYLITSESGLYEKRVMIEPNIKKHRARTGFFF